MLVFTVLAAFVGDKRIVELVFMYYVQLFYYLWLVWPLLESRCAMVNSWYPPLNYRTGQGVRTCWSGNITTAGSVNLIHSDKGTDASFQEV